MYGIYIIATAFAGVATIIGIIALTLWALSKKYGKKYERAYVIYRKQYDAKSEGDCAKYEEKEETFSGGAVVLMVAFLVCLSLALVFAVGSAIALKNAEAEYEQFLATQDVFEQVYVADNELENIKLTETIIEMNHWLVQAKANKKAYGWFSKYYFLNVEDLEPIGKR